MTKYVISNQGKAELELISNMYIPKNNDIGINICGIIRKILDEEISLSLVV